MKTYLDASGHSEDVKALSFSRINTARGYKTFLMLNSAEHEILNAYKYKRIKKFNIF